MNRAQFEQYSAYAHRPITPALFAQNGIHVDLYKRGQSQGVLINYFGSADTFRAIDISEIRLDNGHDLDYAIAYASMQELNATGLQLAPDTFKRKKDSLITSYLMNSSLCYVEVVTRYGIRKTFFATKNYEIIAALADRLAPGEKIKRVRDFQAQLNPSVPEILSGYFDAISLTPDIGGLKIGKVKININNKHTFISTMYSIGNWNDSIIEFLSNHKVRITYLEDAEVKVLFTSLVPRLTAEWLGTHHKAAVQKVLAESQDNYCLGNIILPDYRKRGEFVTVPILNITNIQPVK